MDYYLGCRHKHICKITFVIVAKNTLRMKRLNKWHCKFLLAPLNQLTDNFSSGIQQFYIQ